MAIRQLYLNRNKRKEGDEKTLLNKSPFIV